MFHADILVPLVEAATSPEHFRKLATRPFDTVRDAEAWLSRNRLMWRDALLDNETRFQMLVTDADGELALLIEHDSAWDSKGVRHSRRALRAMRRSA